MLKEKKHSEIFTDLNTIISFLAKRDIKELSAEQLAHKFNIRQADLLIILGSGIPAIAEDGGRAYKNGIAKNIMIVGGIGHSTKYLEESISNNHKYSGIKVSGRAEADILKEVIIKEGIPEGSIIIENKSTNCGSNAEEALKVINSRGLNPKTIILMQDPTMQLRTHASFMKQWSDRDAVFISYAPFIPLLKQTVDSFDYVNKEIYALWDIERFISLVMGEIPRIRDDKDGYGPSGKGYIEHVDIPKQVIRAYERLYPFYSEYIGMRNAL